MTFQAFGVSKDKESVQAMLIATKEMTFFLRTTFGDSKNSAGTKIRINTQGQCQGNGAAPTGWVIMSITILGAHKRKGYGANIVCPILKLRCHLAAILYVDDTDVVHVDMDSEESVEDTHFALQASLTNWGNL